MTWESCGSQGGRGKRRAAHCSVYSGTLSSVRTAELERYCKDLPGQLWAGNACSRPALRRTARAARSAEIHADCCTRWHQAGHDEDFDDEVR